MKKRIYKILKIAIIALFTTSGIYYKSPLFASCALVFLLVSTIDTLNKK